MCVRCARGALAPALSHGDRAGRWCPEELVSSLRIRAPTSALSCTGVFTASMRALQVLVKDGVHALEALKHTGTCVVVEGEMKTSPEGASQKAELHATAIKFVGPCAPALYLRLSCSLQVMCTCTERKWAERMIAGATPRRTQSRRRR